MSTESNRARKCDFCRWKATRQCDAREGGKTCNAYLCARHATPYGGERDLCPDHSFERSFEHSKKARQKQQQIRRLSHTPIMQQQ